MPDELVLPIDFEKHSSWHLFEHFPAKDSPTQEVQAWLRLNMLLRKTRLDSQRETEETVMLNGLDIRT